MQASIFSGMNKAPENIWVTQTLPRALDSAADYEVLGLKPIVSPLLKIKASNIALTAPSPETTLIFTARNGVFAFCEKHKERFYDVFCVGDATANLAKEQGFQTVFSASGTAEDLLKLVQKNVPFTQTIIHCSGRHVRGQITERLKVLGYCAERIEYYASYPVDGVNVPPENFDYVAIYSPLAAKTFAELCSHKDLSRMTSLSISKAADKPLMALNLKNRLIAPLPAQSGMLECLRLDLP